LVVVHVPDVLSFQNELLVKLKKERLLFVTEIIKIGKTHGLSREQVDRILAEAEVSGLGFSEIVFVCSEVRDNG
jgi:hypothetical protein